MVTAHQCRTKSTKANRQTTINKMSATIMMPQAFDQAILEMCGDAMAQVVAALSDKYGFDADEASRFLELESIKIARKRGPSPKKSEDKPEKTKKSKKEKKEKQEATEDKPKRSPTGYLLFSKALREEVKVALTEKLGEDEKLKPQDVVSQLAVQWKALEQDERDEWNSKAKTPVTSDED